MAGEGHAGPEVQRLDHLLIIGHAIRRLQIRELVDDLVARDPRSRVSTGECIEAMIASILLGSHTLYLVDERLSAFDLEIALGFSGGALARHFNDDRLCKALDHVFRAGISTIYSHVLMRAMEVHDLDVSVLHADTSTVTLYGDYRGSPEPRDPEDPAAIPRVTYGHSKDRRPDLKQVMLSLVATGDGAVPFFGRVSSGNRADPLELRFTIRELLDVLPSPRSSTLVMDCKAFCVETLSLIERSRLRYVTLIPRGLNVWSDVYAQALADREQHGPAPVVKRREEGGENRFWRGRSYAAEYEQKDDEGVMQRFALRALVVHSDALRDRKRGGLERRKAKELRRLEKLAAKLAKQTYSCRKDADAAADEIVERGAVFHRVAAAATRVERPMKRSGPGRPRKDDVPQTEKVWQIEFAFVPDEAAFERVLAQESTFVLATNVPADERDDVALLDLYDDQFKVEGAFHWAKTPLAVAPVFLKTEKRIAALGVVYVLSLLTYGLIQRDVRERLAAQGCQISGNVSTTDKPTAEVLFRLFHNISSLRLTPDGPTTVMNMNTEQMRVLELLECGLLSRPDVTVATPVAPRRGSRAWRGHAAFLAQQEQKSSEATNSAQDPARSGRGGQNPNFADFRSTE